MVDCGHSVSISSADKNRKFARGEVLVLVPRNGLRQAMLVLDRGVISDAGGSVVSQSTPGSLLIDPPGQEMWTRSFTN